MIGDWIVQGHVFSAAVVVLFVPGLLIGALVRLRGLALWAFAPVLSVAMLAVLAIALDRVGVRWGVLPLVVGVLCFAVGAFFLGLAVGRSPRPSVDRRLRLLLVAGLCAGAIFGAARFLVYVGEPGAISQTNDAIFHLNAVEWADASGSASSLDIVNVIGSAGFYPAAWHAVVSATVLSSGGTIPVAVNMTSLVIGFVVWPLGMAWMVRVMTASTVVAAAAAAFSTVFATFPMLLFQWGVLYPNALSIALAPAVVAMTLALRGASADRAAAGGRRWVVVLAWAVLVLTGLVAIALAQPSTLIAWALLVAGSLVGDLMNTRSPQPVGRRAWLAAGGVVLVTGVWWVLSSLSSESLWPTWAGGAEAGLQVLVNAQAALPPMYGVSVLVIIGVIVAVLRPELRGMVLIWAALSGLYWAAAAVNNSFVRDGLLIPWYADSYRLAALTVLAVVPLAAVGTVWAVREVVRRVRPAAVRRTAAVTIVCASVVAGLAFAVRPMVMMPRVTEHDTDTTSRFSSESDVAMLSDDERALIERTPEHVEPGAVIIGNPTAGSGFGYVLTGLDVIPKTWAVPDDDTWTEMGKRLRYLGTDAEACRAWQAAGAPGYVYDFGAGEQSGGRITMPGFTRFDDRPGFELVDRQGAASLWRITGCDG